MITNKFVARSLWPVNGILVTSFFRRKVASVRWFIIKWLQNPSWWNFSMRVSPMWPNAVPHMCGILLVLRHLALVLWMYHNTINIHNIRSIDDGNMALMLFIILNNNCSFMNNTLQQTLCKWARVYKTLKWFIKVNTEVNYYYQYS